MDTPELAFDLEPTEEDRLLQAQALVRSYCGWHIAPVRTAETAVVRADGHTALLPSLHVVAVASVTRDDGTVLDADTYQWTAAGVVTGDWLGCDDLTVIFTHGYEDPPADVTGVVQALAKRAIANPGSVVRRDVGPFANTYSQVGFNQSVPLALLDAEKAILDRYRIPSRP